MAAKSFRPVLVHIAPSQHDALRALSGRTGVPMTEFWREAVADLLAKHRLGSASAPKRPEPAREPGNIIEGAANVRTPKPAKSKPTAAERKDKMRAAFEAARHRILGYLGGKEIPSACGVYSDGKGGRIEIRLTDKARYIARCTAQDGAVSYRRMSDGAADKIARPGNDTKGRRQRLNELHPDKLGRAQTEAEREEYTFLATRKRQDQPRTR